MPEQNRDAVVGTLMEAYLQGGNVVKQLPDGGTLTIDNTAIPEVICMLLKEDTGDDTV